MREAQPEQPPPCLRRSTGQSPAVIEVRLAALLAIMCDLLRFAVPSPAVVNFYFIRFWSPRRSGVTLAITHKAGFFDRGGRHPPKVLGERVTGRTFLL